MDSAEALGARVVALPGVLYAGPPKSRASNRTVALDRQCLGRLRDQVARQDFDLLEHRYIAQAQHEQHALVLGSRRGAS